MCYFIFMRRRYVFLGYEEGKIVWNMMKRALKLNGHQWILALPKLAKKSLKTFQLFPLCSVFSWSKHDASFQHGASSFIFFCSFWKSAGIPICFQAPFYMGRHIKVTIWIHMPRRFLTTCFLRTCYFPGPVHEHTLGSLVKPFREEDRNLYAERVTPPTINQ